MEIIIDKNNYPYFNLGLGKWIRNKEHFKLELKAQNCVEVGNEEIRSIKNRGKSALETRREHGKGKPPITKREINCFRNMGLSDREIGRYYKKIGAL